MDSINPLAAPNVAMTHIQKMAPGPPVTTDSNTGNIADADAGGGGNTKSLEGRDVSFRPWSAGPFQNTAEHFSDVGNLDKTSAEGEPKADADQKSDQDVGPKDVV